MRVQGRVLAPPTRTMFELRLFVKHFCILGSTVVTQLFRPNRNRVVGSLWLGFKMAVCTKITKNVNWILLKKQHILWTLHFWRCTYNHELFLITDTFLRSSWKLFRPMNFLSQTCFWSGLPRTSPSRDVHHLDAILTPKMGTWADSSHQCKESITHE